MPTEDDSEDDNEYLQTDTGDLNLISRYCGLNFTELLELDCYTYRVLFRDAYINKLSKTDEGREYLQNCWLLRQTQPDRNALRKQFTE